jgi:hypothetical protein
MARLIASHEGYLRSLMFIPKFEPAFFFRTMPLISRDMRKRTRFVDMSFKTIEFERLLQGQTNQDTIAVGVQDKSFFVIEHEPQQRRYAVRINMVLILR